MVGLCMYNEESKLLGTQVLLEVKVIENQEYYNYIKKIQNTYFYSFKMIFFGTLKRKE
jgi:hypothetical protein